MNFLYNGLMALDQSLRKRGSYLILRKGEPRHILRQLVNEFQVEMIFAEPDYSPYAMQRDRRLAEELPMSWEGSPYFYPPGSVLKQDGNPFVVFTPFSRNWKALPLAANNINFSSPPHIPTPGEVKTEQIPDNPEKPFSVFYPASEAQAQSRLSQFTDASHLYGDIHVSPIFNYAVGRDRLDLDGTSKLSPYLRFGMLSIRQAVVGANLAIQRATSLEMQKGAQTWLNELIWREFYGHILYHFPEARTLNIRMKGIQWVNNIDEYRFWHQGETGYPVIDAAMRQLYQTGWMHNRARMIVASFLTKDLLIDWRWGERWFMQQLVDGDPASNNGGWQWTAGTGMDAAPYFRIFNPIIQSKKHDPQGRYIRQWLPELLNVPDAFIHEPWKMSSATQKKAGCLIGKDYSYPMVDHKWARARALEVYKRGKTL